LSNIFGTKKQYLLSGIAQKASLPINTKYESHQHKSWWLNLFWLKKIPK
jgi:hypothetical protein